MKSAKLNKMLAVGKKTTLMALLVAAVVACDKKDSVFDGVSAGNILGAVVATGGIMWLVSDIKKRKEEQR